MLFYKKIFKMTRRYYSDFQKVTHCIFDMDGLLLDTSTIYEEIVRRMLEKYKKPYPKDVRLKVLGTTEQKLSTIIVTDLKLPTTVPEFLDEFRRMTNEMMKNVKLKTGAECLLRHLHKNTVPMALATSSSEEGFELKTNKYRQLFDVFNHKVCGSSDPAVKESKPAPDIFLAAAERFCDQPHPSSCLVFEDAPNGVKAAFAAGMQCVMIPENHVPKEMRCGTQVLKSLEDFKPEDFGLPAFHSN